MPEMPEVEVMCQRMHDVCQKKLVTGVWIHRNPGERYSDANHFAGKMIESVSRRGKYMIFLLNDQSGIVCHNAMSGYWDTRQNPWTFDYVEGSREASDKDVRVELCLNDGTYVRYHDSRLFGNMHYSQFGGFAFPNMGREVIQTPRMWGHSHTLENHHIHGAPFYASIFDDKRTVKEILLDQSRVAGIGNIYSVEALWWASVRPDRKGHSLTTDERAQVAVALQHVVETALSHNLKYHSYLQVYRKKKCGKCSGDISKIEIAKRSTYFCSVCQS